MKRLQGALGLLMLSSVLVRQGALTQFGLTEASARELVMAEVESGGTDSRSMSARSYAPMVIKGRAAYQKIPAASRAQATVGLFAWARAHVSSPAFKTAYIKLRSDNKPQPKIYEQTIDQELKAKFDEMAAGHEQTRKMVASLPAKDRAPVLAQIKEAEATARSPEFINAVRAGLVEERAKEQEGFDSAMKAWAARYPADPNAFTVKNLKALLAGIDGVDYAAKLVTIVGEGGSTLGFENAAYREKPWMWVECVLAGKDAVAAARLAAEAWLRELGG